MKADVAIVGGGAIGACCALELARRGARVTLYERGPGLAAGCSAGNAGLICPSHSNPIANPTSLRNGVRWMWKRDSPFYLRPRPSVLPWLARFALAARRSEAGAAAIRELSDASLELHASLGDELGTSFERTGTLNVYETLEGVEAEARHAARSGLSFEVFDEAGTRGLEPALIGPVAGSVRYPQEGRVDPRRFVETIGRAAVELGVEIRTGAAVRSLDELQAGTVVVAAGAWSKELVRLPLEGGKGYHVDFERSAEDPRIPSWVQETWTIATPLPALDAWPAEPVTPGVKTGPLSASPGRLRLSGTLELAGLDLSISTRRVEKIREGGERWFRGLGTRRVLETWAGLRPCLPDGLPAIGRLDGIVVATGHAMKGVALSPVTGRLVAQLIAGEAPDHDLTPFRPDRF